MSSTAPKTPEHMAALRAGAERPVVCEECGKTYQARSIGVHRASHKRHAEAAAAAAEFAARPTLSDLFSIEEAKASVALDGETRSDLIPDPQPVAAVTELVCEVCGKSFRSASGLGAHRAAHERQAVKAKAAAPVVRNGRSAVAMTNGHASNGEAPVGYEPSVLDIAMAVLSKVSPDGRIAVLDFPEVMVWMEHTRRIVALVGGW